MTRLTEIFRSINRLEMLLAGSLLLSLGATISFPLRAEEPKGTQPPPEVPKGTQPDTPKGTQPDKPAQSDKPAKTDSKPSEPGVSIKMKLLPANQGGTKEPTAEGAKSEGAKSEGAPKAEKPSADSKKEDASKDEKSKDSKTTKPSSTPKPESGTVELKLIPTKPADPPAAEAKPVGSVEMSVQPRKDEGAAKKDAKPAGSVEVNLVPPKEKSSEEPVSDKVQIDLQVPKPAKPAHKTLSDKPSVSRKIVGSLSVPETDKTDESDEEEADEPSADETAADEMSLDEDQPAATKTGPRGGDPGDPGDAEVKPLPLLPGDVPLAEEANPIDVPTALATDSINRSRSMERKQLSSSHVDHERQQRIEALLDYFRKNPENVVRRGPWAIMHTILPYGVNTEIIAGKGKVNAIGWLCHNGISAKQRMFQPTQTGFRTIVGPGVQGHEGQFLAILAQSHVQEDYPIVIGTRKYTIRDLIKYEMSTCREKTELTFKLIGLTHYLKPDQTWRDNRGRQWSIEKLVAEELAQPINGEACGGTHRLMGLTCAVVSRQEAGIPLTGHFERADKFLNDFVEYTFSLQNSDGSFSTEWFERRAEEQNVERKVQTTGHTLEWLVYTLPDEHLRSPEIQKAVDFLLDSLGKNPSKDWPIGPRGHSLRALTLYNSRVHNGQELKPHAKTAKQPGSGAVQR